MFEIDIAASVVIKIKSSLYFTDSGASSNLVYSLPAIRTSSANYLLHFKEGGQAIGIGSAAEYDGAITMGWPVYFNDSISLNKPLGPEYGGTGASSKAGALENLGAFPAAGGTIGTLSQPGSLTVTGNSILQGLTINSSPIVSSTKHYSSIWFTPSIISGEGKRIAELFAYAANSNNSGVIETSQVKLRQYSYSNNSTSILNYYDEFNFPITSAGKWENNTYDILTTKDYPASSDFYVILEEKENEKSATITITDFIATGYLSYSSKYLLFMVPIKKRLDKVINCTCSIETLMGIVRYDGGYILGSSNASDITNGVNLLQSYVDTGNTLCKVNSETNSLFFQLAYTKSASIPTNSLISVYINEAIIKFT